MGTDLETFVANLNDLPEQHLYGRVTAVLGLMVEVSGVEKHLSVGGRCNVVSREGKRIPCEAVGFRNGRALLMSFGSLEGVGLGCKAEVSTNCPALHPTPLWLGRMINALGEPIDGEGPLPIGGLPAPLRASPPPANARQRVAGKVDLGVRALNTFVTLCRGQRMGIFAASGVGKSVLMSMLARYTEADVNVIGLVGERGREVQEFIRDTLGEEGLRRSIIVVATSDELALMRRQAAYTTLALAEFFRDTGRHVLCMIDLITRFAIAQREIGLSSGEPPTTKGYPPTVFSELPKLLERAGPGVAGAGAITGLFTVLVEGDDHDEPVADAVRGIFWTGISCWNARSASGGAIPRSTCSAPYRATLPMCNTEEENTLIIRARRLMATYDDMAEMIRLGAYRKGADPRWMKRSPITIRWSALAQKPHERCTLAEGYRMLAKVLGVG